MAGHILLDTAAHAATVDGAPVSLRPTAAQRRNEADRAAGACVRAVDIVYHAARG